MTHVIARTMDLRLNPLVLCPLAKGVTLSVAVIVVQLLSLLIGGVISPDIWEW